MKFNNYILVSVLSHILCFSIFLLFYPEINTEASVTVFDVDIVDPVIEKPIIPDSELIPVVPVKPLERIPEDSDVSPEKMEGEGQDTVMSDSYRSAGVPHSESGAGSAGRQGTSSEDMDITLPEGDTGIKLNPRDFLFDRGTIEKYAKKGTEKKKDVFFDVSEFHYRGYKRRLKDRIESVWKYPKGVVVPGLSVDLYVTFSIKKDGSLGYVKLVRTSGYESLDRAVMKALEDSFPFEPLPHDWKGEELTMPGHFIYLLGRSIIM